MSDEFEVCRLKIMQDVNKLLGNLYEKTNATEKEVGLIKQTLNNFINRMDSKVEDSQTVGRTMLQLGRENKERINGMINTIGEAHGFSSRASKKSIDTEKTLNNIWLRIFFSILGSTLLSQAILFAAFFMFVRGR
jgi:predicted DNA-binding protein (UPF0251 family)